MMAMKHVKLFLASSIDEFKIERLEFERFIRLLDKILRRQGIGIDLIACEDLSKEMSLSSKQDEINKEFQAVTISMWLLVKKPVKKWLRNSRSRIEARRFPDRRRFTHISMIWKTKIVKPSRCAISSSESGMI